MYDIIIWLISLLGGVVLTLLLQKSIQKFLTRIFGGWVPRVERGVRGLWHSTYIYESESGIRKHDHLMELKQFGNQVVGKSLTGVSHQFKVLGEIYYQIYFTGLWESTVEGDITHGTFQCFIDNKGKSMDGKWLGTSRKHGVNEGNWHWEFIAKKTDSQTKKKWIEEFQSTKAQQA